MTQTLHACVRVLFPTAEVRIPTAFRGPLKLCLRHDNGRTEVCVVEAGGGAATVLPAEMRSDPLAATLTRLSN